MGNKINRLKRFLQEIWQGLTYFEIEQTAQREKLIRRDLFMLLTFGDLLGIPILPPYYALRVLPHILPAVDSWKKRILRERDLTELKSP